jgi:hypothetical protein
MQSLKKPSRIVLGFICALSAVISNCRDALAPTTDLQATLSQAARWPDTLSIAEIATVTAAVADPSGAPIVGVDLEWATSDSAIITIARAQPPLTTSGEDQLTSGLSAVVTTHSRGSAAIIARLNRPGFASAGLRFDVRVDTVGRANWPGIVTVSIPDTARIELAQASEALLAGAKVEWQSSDPFVLNVNGLSDTDFRAQLNPRRTGSALVTATVTGPRIGRTVFQVPVVVGPLKGVQSPAWPGVLSVADTQQVSVSVFDARNRPLMGIPVDWLSTNQLSLEVTRLGAIGKVVAFRSGGTELIARVGDPLLQPTELRAIVTVKGLEVSEQTKWPDTLQVADARRVGVVVKGADNQTRPNPSVQWSSTNTTVFKVDATGMVTALSAGSGELVASVGVSPFQTSEHRATIAVVKLPVVDSLPWPDSLAVTDTVQLPTIVPAAMRASVIGSAEQTQVHWNSTNPAVFTVDASGRLIAISQGSAQAVATIGEPGFQTSERRQTIKVVPLRIAQSPLWPTALNLAGQAALGISVRNANGEVLSGRSVKWRTSNESVLQIDATGLLVALKFGGAEVIATVGEAPFQTAEIRGQIGVIVRWGSISAGWAHTCGKASDRTGFCWGSNRFGELGNGDNPIENALVPRQILAPPAKFDELVAGGDSLYGDFQKQPESHTCSRSSNTLFCWGATISGQVGDGTGPCAQFFPFDVTCSRPTPVDISTGLGLRVLNVVAGGRVSCAAVVIGAGQPYITCWGLMPSSGFGTRPSTGLFQLTSVPERPGVLAGGGHACVTFIVFGVGSGFVKCYGDNGYGQAGDVPNAAIRDGWLVLDTVGENVAFPWAATGFQFANLGAVTGGANHSCILKTVNTTPVQTSSSEAYCWGANAKFQLGTTFTEACDSGPCSRRARVLTFPKPMVTLTAGAEHTCSLADDGTAYCWGGNDYGQLGTGSFGGQTAVPTPIPGILKFTSLSAGARHTCGVATDGIAYCWGLNDQGQLGDGTTVNRASPVRVREPTF